MKKLAILTGVIVLIVGVLALVGPTVASVCRHMDQSTGCPMERSKMPDDKCCISNLPAGPSASAAISCSQKMSDLMCQWDHAICDVAMKTDCPMMGTSFKCSDRPPSSQRTLLASSILLL